MAGALLEIAGEKWRSWISLNASWSTKWWYSTVHIVTVTVGSGVLGLPTVMAYFGWELGTILLIAFMLLSQMCYWQLVQLHENEQGQRFDRYQDLGQEVLGKSLGFWLVVPLQATAQVGIDTVYIVAGAKSLQHVYSILNNCDRLECSKLTLWMLLFVAVQFFLMLLPHLPSITWVSLIAAVTAIGYCSFAWIAILIDHPPSRSQSPSPSPSPPPPPSPRNASDCSFERLEHGYPNGSAAHLAFGIFASLGKLAFATAAGHNIALEIQATIPSTSRNPSRKAMWRGILVAYLIVAFCYLPVALVGYKFFGNGGSCDNVLLRLRHPKAMIVLADLMIFIHLCGSYQVLAMPLFTNAESFLETKFNFHLGLLPRTFSRSTYIVSTFIVAVAFPFFGDLQAFFGGLAIVPTTYVIPSILWHLVRKPEILSPSWFGNLTCISFGMAVMLTSAVSGFRNLIMKREEFGFFQ